MSAFPLNVETIMHFLIKCIKTLHHYYACEIEITFRSKTLTIMSNALHLNINAKYTYKCTCPIQIQLKPLHEVKDFFTNYFFIFILQIQTFWEFFERCDQAVRSAHILRCVLVIYFLAVI